jgi:hypothetical protein
MGGGWRFFCMPDVLPWCKKFTKIHCSEHRAIAEGVMPHFSARQPLTLAPGCNKPRFGSLHILHPMDELPIPAVRNRALN